MYLCRWSGGSVAFPVEGLEDALRSPHPHARERAAELLVQSLQLAEDHAARLYADGHTPVIVRAGRQTNAKSWKFRKPPVNKATRINNAGELAPVEDAWAIPEGYVDTEADKHGPQVHVPASTMPPLRTNKEKAEWYKNYKPQNKTSLWH